MSVIGELTRANREAWDAFTLAHPQGTCFHQTRWADLAESMYGWTPHYLCATRDGLIDGVLPLVHVTKPFGRGALVSTPFCVYGGALANSAETARRLDEAASDLARKLGVAVLEMRQRDRSCPDWCGTDLYATFRKALDPDPARNLAAIPRKQRAMIRKGEKAGLVARRGHDIDTFYRLFCAGMRNLGTPVYPRRLFAALADLFEGQYDVVVVEYDGEPVCAVFSLYFRDEVLPYYAGSVPGARRLAAFDFMYFKLMEYASTDGARLFDFGRSMRGTGSYAFKKNWGFDPQALHYEYDLINTNTAPVIDPDKPLFRWLSATWRRLPLPLANALGPVVSRALY